MAAQAASELPARRAALASSRAEVVRLAELLRLAGRLAFKGQPALLKRLHLAHGKRRSKAVTPPPPAAEPAAPPSP